MKKNEVVQSIKVIVLGLILSLGVSYVLAQPSNNVPGPLNVGTSNQAKQGGLAVGIATWPQYIIAFGSHGDPNIYATSTAKLEVKGVASIDALSVWNDTYLGGNATVKGNTKITSLASSGIKQVCVDNAGGLVFCSPISCHGTYTSLGPTQSSCTGTVQAVFPSYPACASSYPIGTACSTIPGMDSSTCGSALSCSSGCLWTITQPVITNQCSTLLTQSQCAQYPSCTWN